MNSFPFIAYPAIEAHAVVGDRRTAALVAADGTLNWMCLPDYDGDIVFGALLDAAIGGFWRMGPEGRVHGRQRYLRESFVLQTRWALPDGELELLDLMAWPQTEREPQLENSRVVLRRLRALEGNIRCGFACVPRLNFDRELSFERTSDSKIAITGAPVSLHLWHSRHEGFQDGEARGEFTLSPGEEIWSVLQCGGPDTEWSVARARRAMREARRYWQQNAEKVAYTGPRKRQVVRSAQAVHLLSYAPQGSLIAAPTTSLPEGTWMADYRFAWVRDASLSLAILTMLGNSGEARRYMDWLVILGSSNDSPLQVLYGIRGELELTPRELPHVHGYRGRKPVQIGNQAYRQHQLDSLGYLADCALIYIENGGAWRLEHWDMIRRAVDYTADRWREPDFGIWELSTRQHYVSSKVMAWVALDRGIRIAKRLNLEASLDRWRSTMEEIRAEVLDRGWSERLQAFKQHYDSDNMDASALLIPVMDFLPADDPRVLSTIAAVEREITIDGFVHRFVPREAPGPLSELSLGDYEGSFSPCTFWLATSYAKAGQPQRAEEILARAEDVAGDVGLFAEGIDARSRQFTGNSPLLFSQIEYVRAILHIAKARPLDMLRMMPGKISAKLHTGSDWPVSS